MVEESNFGRRDGREEGGGGVGSGGVGRVGPNYRFRTQSSGNKIKIKK